MFQFFNFKRLRKLVGDICPLCVFSSRNAAGRPFLLSETWHVHEVTCRCWKSFHVEQLSAGDMYVSKKWTLKKLWREGWEGLFVFLGEVKSCRMEFTPADFAGCISCHFKVSDTLKKSRRSLWIQRRVISHIKNTASTWYFVCSLVGCRLTWKTWSCFIFLFFCVCLVVLLMQQHPGEAFKVEKQNSIFSFELFFKWADFVKYLAVLFGISVRLQLLLCLASDLRGGWIDTGWQKLLFPLEIN